MKKTINHVTYNTHTAREIFNRSYDEPGSLWFSETTIYQTPKGRYFLYGYGGAGTSYAEDIGNGWTAAGEKLIPLTKEEAIERCKWYGMDETACKEAFEGSAE